MIYVGLGSDEDEESVRVLHPQHPSLMCGDGFLMIARDDRQIIGFAWAFERSIPAPIGGVHEAFINFIAVNDGFRKVGIGSRLVQACIKKAAENGCYQVRAYCDLRNVASHRLWLKNGFGISPIKMQDDSIPGSFVTYVIGQKEFPAHKSEENWQRRKPHERSTERLHLAYSHFHL